jgi:hypothetical protein
VALAAQQQLQANYCNAFSGKLLQCFFFFSSSSFRQAKAMLFLAFFHFFSLFLFLNAQDTA